MRHDTTTPVRPRRLRALASVAAAATLFSGVASAGAAEAMPSAPPEVMARPARADAALDPPTSSLAPAGSDLGRIEQLLTFTVDDVASTWGRFLPATSVNYLWVRPGQVFSTSCGPTSGSPASSCRTDDLIAVDVQFAAAIEAQYGDMAMAAVVAHEYGHNLQAELGVVGNPGRVLPLELHADCLAGPRAGDAHRRGVADRADLDEAVQGAFAFGDHEVGHPGHHGLPEQRAQAVVHGINGGDCSPHLGDVDELTYAEVAERLAVPLGTAKSRVLEGREEAARLLGPRRSGTR